MKGFIVTDLAALAQGELIMSDLVSEGYTTGGLFSGADNGVCPSGMGVDFNSSLSYANAQCLLNSGIHTVIARAYNGANGVDYNACGSLTNAQNAGITNREVYIKPCPTCNSQTQSASTQITDMVNYLKANCPSAWTGQIWLNISAPSSWSTNYSANETFFNGLLGTCMATDPNCGIYTSSTDWSTIFPSNY